jgi:hypothetical protein
MRHKDGQVASLQQQINQMAAAIRTLEKKLGGV